MRLYDKIRLNDVIDFAVYANNVHLLQPKNKTPLHNSIIISFCSENHCTKHSLRNDATYFVMAFLWFYCIFSHGIATNNFFTFEVRFFLIFSFQADWIRIQFARKNVFRINSFKSESKIIFFIILGDINQYEVFFNALFQVFRWIHFSL